MHFLPVLQKYLKSEHTIYTVRRFLYSENNALVFIKGVGGCRRLLVMQDVKKDQLVPYYSKSGFTTLEDWWSKIKEINAAYPKEKLHLYKITTVTELEYS